MNYLKMVSVPPLDPTTGQKSSQKSLLAQFLCWELDSNPRNTQVFLRFESRVRLELEPKSVFLRWLLSLAPEKSHYTN